MQDHENLKSLLVSYYLANEKWPQASLLDSLDKIREAEVRKTEFGRYNLGGVDISLKNFTKVVIEVKKKDSVVVHYKLEYQNPTHGIKLIEGV